jgi:cysteinyl-tRNA synthetase
MEMKIKDTLTNKKTKLEKRKKNRMFVCGPTVYDYSHIGHARTYLAFDIIVRYLRSRGFNIKYIQNITDVDDKIINQANKDNRSPFEISGEFTKAYYEDMEALGINTVNRYIKASEVIPEIISQVKTLTEKEFAYQTSTGIYFRVRKFKEYGKLSNQRLDALESGARVKTDEEKEDPLDFALWKLPKPDKKIEESGNGPVIINGEPFWSSPWGWGRPGWHIEDTAISGKYFGPQYEIHGGAEDLKFPHHESEIAQQEAASGKKPFVKIWMHTGFLTINGGKMGKSKGNFTTIRDFLKKYNSEVIRFMVLSHHYRSRFDYTEKLAQNAEESLESLKDFINKLYFVFKNAKRFKKSKKQLKKDFRDAEKDAHKIMADDLNTPQALGVIFKLIRNCQNQIWDLNQGDAKKFRKILVNFFEAFGLKFKKYEVSKNIERLAKKREKSRVNQQFIKADELRNKIQRLGYEIEDTPLGPFIKKLESI